ncbi:UDP-glucosyltransferase 2-like [Stomoxys calcitrans]|uniref:UDP-glucosyltransferase 2-like n=1 Tax=Stomoxys calcitrans TaxID=35570 RepID=UPI0027E25376|nr:UDP-glucosyltransferase 2-like [Stomoxys calcitrans]
MRFNEIRWIVLMSALNHVAYAERILAIFGFENPTQYSFVESLLKRLVQRGHYVTTITYFSPEQSIPNLRNIVITENEILYNELLNTIIDPLDIDHFNVRGKLYSIGFKICENILGHESVQNLMRNEAFDLIFIDVIFSESLFGFAQHFKAPIVGLSTIGTTSRTDELVGNITPQSYASINRWYSQNINLWMRCLNVALYALERLHYYYEYIAMI